MDGLALLCNLFADGPVTLRRLRAAGVRGLAELEHADPIALSLWLHSSVPHARQFAAEAERLARRLEESASIERSELPRPSPEPEPVRPSSLPLSEPSPAGRDSGQPLRPGLFPGLDEATCLRLQAQQVYTTRTLVEFTSLSLARRSGIPYSSLLELARRARRLGSGEGGGAPIPETDLAARSTLPPERLPAVRAALAALRSPEPTRTDEFTLPAVEPDSAGPFV